MNMHNTFSSRNKKNIDLDAFLSRAMEHVLTCHCYLVQVDQSEFLADFVALEQVSAPDKALFSVSIQGPVVQSMFSLSSLVVKILTVLESTISNSQVFFLKKYWHICHI